MQESRTPLGAAACGMLLLAGLTQGCVAPGPPVPEQPEVLLAPRTTHADAERNCAARLAELHGVTLGSREQARLARALEGDKDVSAATLQEALESSGFSVHLFSGTLDRASTGIRHHLDRGRPLIVLMRGRDGRGHWQLLVGYDDASGVCLVQRNGGSLEALRWQDFEAGWSDADHVALLALPRARKQDDRRR